MDIPSAGFCLAYCRCFDFSKGQTAVQNADLGATSAVRLPIAFRSGYPLQSCRLPPTDCSCLRG